MYDKDYQETKRRFMESSISPSANYVDGVEYYNQLVQQRQEKERLQSVQDISVTLTTELVEAVEAEAETMHTSRDEIISESLRQTLHLPNRRTLETAF